MKAVCLGIRESPFGELTRYEFVFEQDTLYGHFLFVITAIRMREVFLDESVGILNGSNLDHTVVRVLIDDCTLGKTQNRLDPEHGVYTLNFGQCLYLVRLIRDGKPTFEVELTFER